MLKIKRIKVGKKIILAIDLKLLDKHLIVLRGSKGYVMCGYLNLKAADKFGDCAVKITGVCSVQESLRARVHSCSRQARKMGICKGRLIKDILAKIA